MSRARFEVVHTGPWKFHARFVAPNGETVWVTESYRRQQTALDAVWILTNAIDSRGGTLGWDIEVKRVEEPTP